LNRQLLREILLLIGLSICFGFVYTFLAKQGFFSENKPTRNTPAANLEIISIEKAKELFETNAGLFIDTRHEFDYSAGHIRNAVNVALNEFEKHISHLESIRKNKLLIVYCDGTDCNSSIEVGAKLIEMGYTNVKIFFGGWQEWINAGLPIEE
jgi:rhodanese-related sulfurtransferase